MHLNSNKKCFLFSHLDRHRLHSICFDLQGWKGYGEQRYISTLTSLSKGDHSSGTDPFLVYKSLFKRGLFWSENMFLPFRVALYEKRGNYFLAKVGSRGLPWRCINQLEWTWSLTSRSTIGNNSLLRTAKKKALTLTLTLIPVQPLLTTPLSPNFITNPNPSWKSLELTAIPKLTTILSHGL